MTIERLNKIENWMEEDVRKSLKDLKNEVVENKEYIPPKEVERQIKFLDKYLEFDITRAKKEWLTKNEEDIIRKVFKRFIDDVKKHPNAYIMSVEKLRKLWVTHSLIKHGDKFGFIDDFELRKTLWAEFNSISEEEEAVFDKYHILEE